VAVAFVGLTGGMGAGKSTALRALQRLGAAVLSADTVVHELYAGSELRDAVVARWGPEVAPDGQVDRAAVARRAFADDDERRWLEGQIWPRVGERIAAFRADQEGRDAPPPAVVVEVPMLFEAGMEGGFDATIAVVADEAVRAGRAAGRGHAAIDERAAAQLSQAEKAQRATFAVPNNAGEAELEHALGGVLDALAPPAS